VAFYSGETIINYGRRKKKEGKDPYPVRKKKGRIPRPLMTSPTGKVRKRRTAGWKERRGTEGTDMGRTRLKGRVRERGGGKMKKIKCCSDWRWGGK